MHHFQQQNHNSHYRRRRRRRRRRQLEESADFVMTTVAPTSGFYFFQAAQQMKAQCSVDIAQLGMKLSQQLLDENGQLRVPEDDLANDIDWDDGEITPSEQLLFWNPIMNALAPAGEQKCNTTQYSQFHNSMERFQQCTNTKASTSTNQTGDRTTSSSSTTTSATSAIHQTSSFIQDISKFCGLSSFLSDSKDNCTEALLLDNRTRPIVQDMYQYPSKYCSCSNLLRQDLPTCFVTVADMIQPAATTAKRNVITTNATLVSQNRKHVTTFDQAYRRMKFSLSFFQSTLLCAVDLGCNAMDGWCVRQINELERCLQDNPPCRRHDAMVKSNASSSSSSSCHQNLIFGLPYSLTEGKIPDVCLKAIHKHNLNHSVVDDYYNYVETCRLQDLQQMKQPNGNNNNHFTSASREHQRTAEIALTWSSAAMLLLALAVAVVITKRLLLRLTQSELYGDEDKLGKKRRQQQSRFHHNEEEFEQDEWNVFGLQSLS